MKTFRCIRHCTKIIIFYSLWDDVFYLPMYYEKKKLKSCNENTII